MSLDQNSHFKDSYYIRDHFLSEAELSTIREISKGRTFTEGLIGDIVPSLNPKQKIREECYLSPDDSILFDRSYRRIEDSAINPRLGHALRFREPCKIAHYSGKVQGFYNLHRDTQGTGDIMSYRELSAVVFLSSPQTYEGGELVFPDLEVSLKLEAGSAVFFDSSILHGVRPVTQGERYVLITFLFDDGSKVEQLRGESYLEACRIAGQSEDIVS